MPTPPVEPKRERYVVHDSTYQALGVILADNPRGILALADELSGLLQSLDKEGQEAICGDPCQHQRGKEGQEAFCGDMCQHECGAEGQESSL